MAWCQLANLGKVQIVHFIEAFLYIIPAATKVTIENKQVILLRANDLVRGTNKHWLLFLRQLMGQLNKTLAFKYTRAVRDCKLVLLELWDILCRITDAEHSLSLSLIDQSANIYLAITSILFILGHDASMKGRASDEAW